MSIRNPDSLEIHSKGPLKKSGLFLDPEYDLDLSQNLTTSFPGQALST